MATGTRAASARMISSSTLDTARFANDPAPSASRRWRGLAAVSPTREDEPASDRILRRLGLTFGLAGVIAAVVQIPEIADQSRFAPVGWTLAAMLLVFGPFAVLAAVSPRMSRRVIQTVAGVAALGYVAAMVVLMIAYQQPETDATSLWLYRIFALGVLAAALAWRPAIAIGYLLVGGMLAACANMYILPHGTAFTLLVDFARAAGLCALFLWCAIFARAAAARVDRESTLAGSRAAAVAGAAARDRERARFAALIHDAVLSTLLDASRAGTESPVLRKQAERTLAQLDELRGTEAEPDRLGAQAAVGFLRAAVHEVNPGIEFGVRRWPGVDDLRLPVDAAGAMAAALAEAVRNSLRHAAAPGRAVHRSVTVTLSAGGIRVVFRDDGAGFDPGQVPADRLGISVSILGRMRRLAGGAAFVESQPGEGTTVTLVWGSDG